MYITYFQCTKALNLVDIHEFFYTPRKEKKEKNKEIYMGNFINNAPFALVIVFLIIGFVLLIKGADFFVEGSSSVAKRLHVPSIIIGLTIVAMGTSLPETAVSVSASVTGNNELAVSNVVGSNIFNLMVVIGVCAMIATVNVAKETIKRDIPFSLICAGLLLLLSNQIRFASQKRVLVEIALIKLCRPAMETNLDSVLDRLRVLEKQMEERPVQQVIVRESEAGGAGEPGAAVTGTATVQQQKPQKAAPEDLQKIVAGWRAIVGQTTGLFKQSLQRAVPKYNGETGDPILYVEFQDFLGMNYVDNPEAKKVRNYVSVR